MTIDSVVVRDGLFIAVLKFEKAFVGLDRWVEMEVRTNVATSCTSQNAYLSDEAKSPTICTTQ